MAAKGADCFIEITSKSFFYLEEVKRLEKRYFPASERFDFDSELRRSSTKCYCYVREKHGESVERRLPCVLAYAVYSQAKMKKRINKLCVAHEYRRNGHGTSMLHHVIGQICRNLNEGTIDLWVGVLREHAIRCYLKSNFIPMETVRDYYGPERDAIRMVYAIQP